MNTIGLWMFLFHHKQWLTWLIIERPTYYCRLGFHRLCIMYPQYRMVGAGGSSHRRTLLAPSLLTQPPTFFSSPTFPLEIFIHPLFFFSLFLYSTPISFSLLHQTWAGGACHLEKSNARRILLAIVHIVQFIGNFLAIPNEDIFSKILSHILSFDFSILFLPWSGSWNPLCILKCPSVLPWQEKSKGLVINFAVVSLQLIFSALLTYNDLFCIVSLCGGGHLGRGKVLLPHIRASSKKNSDIQ